MLALEQDFGTASLVKELCQSLWSRLSAQDRVELEAGRSDLVRFTYLAHKTAIRAEIETELKRIDGIAANDFRKNKAKALNVKASGNQAFGNAQNEEALNLYSQAIAWMPVDETTDLSVLHANRSAALFHLEETSAAQQDIETAFKLGYPAELQYKLHERSGRCWLREGKKSEATRRFQQALKALSQSSGNLEPAKLEKTRQGLEKLAKSCSDSGFGFLLNGGQDSQAAASKAQTLPAIAGGRGRPYKNASTKLSVQYNEAEGRHIIATQTIQPGEVILVEKAYVSAMTPEAFHQQCFQCYEMLWASVPCSSCALVSFCSAACRDLAWKTHHKHECGILSILRSAGISITCLMALRVLTQSGVGEVMKWTEDDLLLSNGLQALQTVQQHNANEDYRADHISAVLKLVSHSEERRLEDVFQRIVMTFFLLALLRRTSFFAEPSEPKAMKSENGAAVNSADGHNDAAKETEDTSREERVEILSGTILLRVLQILQFNAHEIAGWDSGLNKSCFIGGGLFPTLAFFNHSCNPAIVRYFVNDTVVVRTVRTLLRGEPVTENYGPIFTQSGRAERQAHLKSRYWFDCKCVACENDWPLFRDLSQDTLSFRCSNCRAFLCNTSAESLGLFLRCARCLKPTNILSSLKTLQNSEGKFNQAMEFLSKGRVDTASGILLENMKLFDSILLPPFRDYHWCQEGLRKCYLPMGNKCRASRLGPDPESQSVNEHPQQGAIVD